MRKTVLTLALISAISNGLYFFILAVFAYPILIKAYTHIGLSALLKIFIPSYTWTYIFIIGYSIGLFLYAQTARYTSHERIGTKILYLVMSVTLLILIIRVLLLSTEFIAIFATKV